MLPSSSDSVAVQQGISVDASKCLDGILYGTFIRPQARLITAMAPSLGPNPMKQPNRATSVRRKPVLAFKRLASIGLE
eukprot:3213571-Amphidinium_carterae.2